jgi:hypothetical protein
MVRRPHAARGRAATIILAALLALAAYAAIADGAVTLPEETWLQVALALLGLGTAAAWLGPQALRPAAAPLSLAGLGLLVLLAAWTGASLLWSVTPDRTWGELNRTIAYALVVAIAIAAASSAPRAIERVAVGWLLIASAIALYALAGRVFPGVIGHATEISRLRAPLEYWNALALVCALAAPVAIRVATSRDIHVRWRILALVALFVLMSVIGLTYSRGGIVALAVVVVVLTAVGGARLPGLAVVALAALATAPVLAFAYGEDALRENAQPLAAQIDAGLKLGVVVVLAGALLAVTAWWLVWAERRVPWSAQRTTATWATLGAVAIGLAAGGLAVVASSDRGIGGTIEQAADDFTEVRKDEIYSPGRLLTTGSGNRWSWWRESAGAWSDEPVLGWGAASFGTSRRLYREAPSDVLHPHSLPMQWLAELGIVGLLLGAGAIGLLLAGAATTLKRLTVRRERDLAAALLAGAAAWAVHACVDWDWDIPGVTVPVLLFLGVLAARTRPAGDASAVVAFEEPSPGRPIALFGAGLLALGCVVSALLPAWSDHKTDGALTAMEGERSESVLAKAAKDAEMAADLDPLAVRPLFAAAAVAEARGRLLDARRYLIDAVERQPYSIDAWRRLTRVALALADREGVERASRRALALDPGDLELIRFVSRAQGILAPPEGSATASGTPLPSGGATGTAVPDLGTATPDVVPTPEGAEPIPPG